MTLDETFNKLKSDTPEGLTDDTRKTYQIGEISQATGLMKTATGWVTPNETKYGKVAQKNGKWGVQQKQGKGSTFIPHKNEREAKRALSHYTIGYNTTERSKQDPHSTEARQHKQWNKEVEKMRKENRAERRAEHASHFQNETLDDLFTTIKKGTQDAGYEEGHVSHRKDGDYIKQGDSWVPMKGQKQEAGKEEAGADEQTMRQSLINFMTKGLPHVPEADAKKAVEGLPADTLNEMFNNLKEQHGDKYLAQQEAAPEKSKGKKLKADVTPTKKAKAFEPSLNDLISKSKTVGDLQENLMDVLSQLSRQNEGYLRNRSLDELANMYIDQRNEYYQDEENYVDFSNGIKKATQKNGAAAGSTETVKSTKKNPEAAPKREAVSAGRMQKDLDGNFWSRPDDFKEDITSRGWDVEEMNNEYAVISNKAGSQYEVRFDDHSDDGDLTVRTFKPLMVDEDDDDELEDAAPKLTGDCKVRLSKIKK